MVDQNEAIEHFKKWAGHALTSKSGMYNVVLKREIKELCERMGLTLTSGVPAEPPKLVRAEMLAAE